MQPPGKREKQVYLCGPGSNEQNGRLGGLSLPGNSFVRLTDRPDMIIVVYRGRKPIRQQHQHTVDIQWLEH